ncbi:TnsA endonuclease N-terminal domain-containing protein [Calothrix sp. NIES-2098]|uniref:TnsA endonuclease N-terminal domain-containing protein n=1 Tax=Calothrix sp. NIES-2098 TaxID=1954171 RepID=UPI000B5F16EC|nr:integrase, catalytic region [Calothrix sp. NIES-2098]
MLSKNEFDNWCDRLTISEQCRKLIQAIRSSEPSRRVGGGSRNVSGRYPSRKMGLTIQFESHRVELPRIYELEHDEDVIEFYDQPLPIKIDYQDKNRRKLSHFHTPDFFVIRSKSAGWEECKPKNNLQKLAEKSPNRYCQSKDGQWYSPPGEDYAKQFGLYYRLYSDAEINWFLQRNIIFLEDYYRRSESLVVKERSATEVLSLVSDNVGISLANLLSNLKEASADEIYTLIATEKLYVNLSAAPLAEPSRVHIFRDQQTANAYVLLQTTLPDSSFGSPIIKIVAGTSICWDGKGLSIVHVGEREIVLSGEDEQLIKLKKAVFENLIHQGEITSLQKQETPTISEESWERFYKASPQDQEEALRRYKAIEPYLQGQPPEKETISDRTIRDWKAKYLAAQQNCGCGYIGLLSHSHAKGNRNRKLPKNTLALMEEFILEDYETIKQKKMFEVYGSLVLSCEKNSIIAPSYKTFVKEVKRRAGYDQTKKRQGHRAAYQHQEFYWELKRTTPRHGDRPFEIGHIDHTELDAELVCSSTGRKLDRPWATFLVDAYSRRLLAVYLSFDPPSYRSCLMVLRLCVKNHGRLPQIVVVDNGSEFHSTYFETLLATFECTKKHRPPAKARFSAICERLFGTSNTQFVHNLQGNTQITRNVRQVTKSVNPKNHAIWTLNLLYEYLCVWAYEVYDIDEHPSLGQSPREAFATGMLQSGSRTHLMISYDENFRILTLPTTERGKAKVQIGHGVKINYIYYWSNAFRDPEIENTSVPIRYDPFDAGTAYAFVRGQWVQCISQYYADFHGRSEKEMKLATIELRKRQQNHTAQLKISAKNLAEFLGSLEAQEVLLKQRSRDAEVKGVLQIIEGGQAKGNRVETSSLEEMGVNHSHNQTQFQPLSSGNVAIASDELEVYEEF